MLKPMLAQPRLILPFQTMNFTGKTEDGHKYRTPKLRMRCVKRVPAPGDDLKIPENLDHEQFCRQIGGDCDDISDKFESLNEVMTLSRKEMKIRGVPTQ